MMCMFAMPAAAVPTVAVTDVGVVGGNRLLEVMVAPDVTSFVPNTSLAVELDFEFSSDVVGAVLNDSFWNVQGVNPGNNPFTGGHSEGLVVDTANDTVFVAVGSELFATATPMRLMTVEVSWQQYTSFNMGGRVVLPGTPEEYLSGRIAQDGTNFDGISLSPPPRVCSFDGDFDCSGASENGDLTLLLDNWGHSMPPVPVGWSGVPLTPPAIDNDELTALLDGWGNIVGGGSLGSRVPEPNSASLLGLATFGLTVVRRAQRRLARSAERPH